MSLSTVRIALPSKGQLYDGAIELLKSAGFRVQRASDRQYEARIAGHERFEVAFMRPGDAVAQVEEGRCALGVTGFDVFREHQDEAEHSRVVIPGLGYGGCRLVVAVPEDWVDVAHALDLVDLSTEFKAAGRPLRVSTKYPNLSRDYFRKVGIYYYQLIHAEGALELHPRLDIADIIVDLTSSGTTLRDNRLREIAGGTVIESEACLIGHGPTLASLVAEGEGGPLALMLDALDGVRAAEGWLHLEVVGAEDGGLSLADAADEVASLLREKGARQVTALAERGGWWVTALVRSRSVAALRRPLGVLGATQIVALPARFAFDRDAPATFDSLTAREDA
jgi:ATP phosphoribosyltransferase